jgi:hypothetical protein
VTVPDGRDAAPLSVAEEAMWYSTRLNPRRLSYNETVPIHRRGALDPEVLRRTLEELLRRHETLRTHLPVVDGRPSQVVGETPRLDLPLVDLSHLSPEAAEREALTQVAEVSRGRYRLASDPLVRPLLFSFPGEESRLYLAMHHIAFDGVSLVRILMPELATLYEAFAEGRPSPLPEPTIRYVDYARWEQDWIAKPRAERRLDYWVERLSADRGAEVPLDHERPPEPRLGAGAIPVSLPAATVERLRAAGRDADVTLFQTLAAAWAVLLSGYAESTDVVFATAADLRQRPELQHLFGCCLTPLPLLVDVGADLSFVELTLRVRDELLDGIDHLVPFERVARRLPPPATPAGNPVYQTMIVLEPAVETADPDWSIQMIDPKLIDAVGTFKLDLEIQLHEQADGGLVGQLIYDRDLFERPTAAGIARDLESLCAAVAADSSLAVKDCLASLKEDRVSAERSESGLND